jgi:hypothetical protein
MFSAVSALAVTCHYSAIVFLGACSLVSITLIRRMGWQRVRNVGLSLLVPLGVFAWFYFTHARYRPLEGYLYDFYWRLTPNEALPGFVLRNLQNFWNLFSPVEIHNRAVFLLAFTMLCALCALVMRRGRDSVCSLVTVAVAVTMSLELLILSIARKYPFGGLLRHQYVVGTFLILAVFVVVDRLVAMSGPGARNTLLGSIGFLVIGNLIAASPRILTVPDELLYREEMNAYKSLFPNPEAVYLDHWGVIGYYIHTNHRRRRFVRRIAGDGSVDQYHADGIPKGVEIFYDKGRSTLDMSDPAVYRSFAACLKQSGINELTLFMFHPGYIPFPDAPDLLKQKILKEASAQGLSISKLTVDTTTIFAGFSLK